MKRYNWFLALTFGGIHACSGYEGEPSGRVSPDSIGRLDSHLLYSLDLGVRCEDDFQNNWQATWSNNNACWDFGNTMDGHGQDWEFYYNLVGAQARIEETSDATFGPDDVELFLLASHGGINSTSFVLAMWDQNSLASSTQMRVGDDGDRGEILSLYSCNTMKVDGNTFTRWNNTFRGGLKYATGAHGLVFNGGTTQTFGADYANDLDSGDVVGAAWGDNISSAYSLNRPAAIATGNGANANDCWARYDSDVAEVLGLSRRTDNDVIWMCWVTWGA